MTRYQATRTMRPVSRIVRAWRKLRHPHGSHTTMTSESRLDIAFRTLIPYPLRSAHRLWAHRRGYFWMPCPLCGRDFGGHESRSIAGKPASVPDPTCPPRGPCGPLMSVTICPPCTRAGRGVEVELPDDPSFGPAAGWGAR
jgi:hypothetical protein